MHKLAKGLKKKKKQKKGKKGAEEDEFDPEELERYRRERAEALEKASESTGEQSTTSSTTTTTGEATTTSSSTASGSDEWKKFQALTAGIDSVLKKTQGDLDRIKSTSFYQRKTPIVEEQKPIENPEIKKNQEKRYVGFDKDGNPIEQIKINTDDNNKNNNKLIVSEEGFVEIPDDDDDEQDDSNEEDIFDTTYVDVLQNIDVQLAYIPDSPTEEEFGDDPFDTTNADKVLKTVDKKGKKVVSLGNAVEVLSGRIDHVSTCKISRPRKILTHDLLLDDNDTIDCDTTNQDSINEQIEIEKTLLDDDTDIPDIPIDLTKLPSVLPRPVTPLDNNNIDNKIYEAPLDISEFELLSEKTILEAIPDFDDIDNIDIDNEISKLDEADDPFAEKEPDNIEQNIEIYEASFVAATFVNEEDPFDTTFADNILPGKTELKFIEKELDELPEAEVSISLIDPAGLRRDYETGKLKIGQDTTTFTINNNNNNNNKDLLGGSTSDLNKIADLPIVPIEEIKYTDPFDTSGIKEPLPGKIELKFLEQELLSESNNNNSLDNLDDDDFDPRKEEENIIKPSIEVIIQAEEANGNLINKERKASRPEALSLGGGSGKSVGFELPTPSKRPDLLITSDEEKSISSKPLTPYYTQKSIEESLPELEEDNEIIDVDPFDTSFVGKVAPGKTELKLIEKELLKKESKLTHSTSNQDLNLNNKIVKNIGRRQSDFGTTTVRPKSLKLTDIEDSLIEDKEENKYNNIAEINKTVHNKKFIKRQESLLDADVVVDAKPLTPKIEKVNEEDETDISYVDPFDTSIAKNILPGKAELKQLESELSQISTEIQKVRLPNIDLAKVSIPAAPILQDEDNFDPRAEEISNTEDFLALDHQDLTDKVLTPLSNKEFLQDNNNIDPFDTSFASIGPGKTELKLLESELMD